MVARGDLIRKLFRSFSENDREKFYAIAIELIEEERNKNHLLLANELEKSLQINVQKKTVSPNNKPWHIYPEIPKTKDTGLPLITVKQYDFSWDDVVLTEQNRQILETVVLENRKQDTLSAYNLKPRSKLLFCGPPGCGKTFIEKKQHLIGINPKLIFKIKVRKNDSLENHLPSLGLNLLAKEPKAKQAIVVFGDDNHLTEFQNRLNSYTGTTDGLKYDYLDDIEELVPLESEDRIGPLLKLNPLEPSSVVPLDMELWHTGNKEELKTYIDGIDNVLREIQPKLGMRVSDRYIGNYICNVRILVNLEILELLLQEYQVKEIDRRPKPAFESPVELRIPLADLPEISSPALEARGILVIDSGVQRGHPLISPALGDADVFPDRQQKFVTGEADDGDTLKGGHGTGVAGIAIYGDVTKCVKNKSFQPEVWLFSARVTNENNEYKEESLLENQLEDAIDYFVENYSNCKVINISLGDSRLIYQEGEKQFRLAARIDEIAYRLQHKNIIFVISAGNFWYDSDSREQIHTEYPNYLLQEDARIIDPATAAIALTVGSLSMGTGSLHH